MIEYYKKKSFSLLLLFLLFLVFSVNAEESNPKVLRLSLKDTVKQVIETNATVQNAKFEILKADTPIYKNESKFTWKIIGEALKSETKLPYNQNNFLSGTKLQTDKLSAGVEKQFSTGTYFMAEVSTIRFDSNALENPYTTPSAFAFLGVKPLYTGAVSVKLSQELLKYSFGRTEKIKEQMLRTQATMQQDTLIFQLTQLVTQTLVEYWSLSVADSSVLTFERLLANAKNIRNLTARKQAIGTAERFEQSQWNSVVASVESQVERAKLERDDAKRRLQRILGISHNTEINGVTDLVETLPELNLEKDIEYALENRVDLKNLRKQKELSKQGLIVAEDEDMPSLKVSGTASSRAQSLISPQDNYYLGNYNGIRSWKYPEYRADITLSYPLWDQGVKTSIRDAQVNVKEITDMEFALKREIEDELKTRYEAVKSSHTVLITAKQTEEETKKFYEGLVTKFVQGRYSALAVKNALDAYTQAQLVGFQAKINFNINLLRYDLAKNYIFEKYDIDVYKILDELKKAALAHSN
ncbi:MAG: TolC family protein [Leptospiraceae bacterium]|nr:TolC family protein [Leptospiraceae bacterium]